jgi:hypothetical protein
VKAGQGNLAALALGASLVLAACSPSPGSPSTLPSSAAPTNPPAAATPLPSPATPRPTGPSGSPASGLVNDPSLLGILPAEVAGVALASEPESFDVAAGDPAFTANVEAAAFAVVVDGDDLASGVVARLKPGVFSDAFYRDWRDTYDEGACSQAGGVTGHAQAELGGRTVFITSCAGGLRTYHAHLAERGVVVSLFALGDRRFGEQIMAALRP